MESKEIQQIKIEDQLYQIKDKETNDLLLQTIHAINDKNKAIAEILGQINASMSDCMKKSNIVALSKSEYESLGDSVDPDTIYLIKEEED